MGSPSHNQLKIFFLNSLFIHFLLQDFSQIHYLLHKVTMNSLSISQIHYDFTMVRASIMNRLSFSRFHLLFFEFTINSFFFSRIHYEFTTFFANILWIHYLFREFTIDLLRIEESQGYFLLLSLFLVCYKWTDLSKLKSCRNGPVYIVCLTSYLLTYVTSDLMD